MLRQTGSVRGAADVIGVHTGSLYRFKKREPAFATEWDRAAEHGAMVEKIARPWRQRQHDFFEALPRLGWKLEAAAEAAGIPTRLAEIASSRNS
jgi:hypothetical protein